MLNERGRKLSVVLIVLLSCSLPLLNIVKSQSTSQITSQGMQTYAQTLINTYTQETNTYFPATPTNLTFYSNASYSIKFYSSSQGGAGILIEPASVQSFQTINTSDRIDIAIFGGNPSLSAYLHAPMVRLSILRFSFIVN